MLALLRGIGPTGPPSPAELLEYAPPRSNLKDADYQEQIPPLWFTIAGHNGYWPIAYQFITSDVDTMYTGARSSLSDGEFRTIGADPPSRLWACCHWTLTILGASYVILSFLVVYPRFQVDWLQFFNLMPNVWERERRARFLSLTGLSLAAAYAAFEFPLWHPVWSPIPNEPFGGGVIPGLVEIGLLLSATFPARVLLRPLGVLASRGAWTQSNIRMVSTNMLRSSSATLIGWAAFTLFVVMAYSITAVNDRHQGFFLIYRCLHLNSGVAPSLPCSFWR